MDVPNHLFSPPFVVLTELELLHFRNLKAQELEFPPEGAAIVGDNAQGKTNLLEAVYYLETFRSFRGASDQELTTFQQSVFRVSAKIRGGKADSVAAAVDQTRKRKKVTVDGIEARPLSTALGNLGAVVFSPADVDLISDGPSRRRRFLDVVLSLNSTGYVDSLQRYRKALAQRNAALKGGSGRGQVSAWDQALAASGARVTEARKTWVESWTEKFGEYYGLVSGGGEARMEYRSRLAGRAGDGEADLESGLLALLDEAWPQDQRLRSTSVGPHRDELHISVNDGTGELSARSYGSGGQRRSAALGLRLVEAATIRSARAIEPLLLLDDAFAELDDRRSSQILSLLASESTGQVIVTAPKRSDIDAFRGRLPEWSIRAGVVTA